MTTEPQTTPDEPFDIDEMLKQSAEAFAAMPPIDQALMLSDQKRSFVRGGCGIDRPDVMADEVRRLRGDLQTERAIKAANADRAAASDRANAETIAALRARVEVLEGAIPILNGLTKAYEGISDRAFSLSAADQRVVSARRILAALSSLQGER